MASEYLGQVIKIQETKHFKWRKATLFVKTPVQRIMLLTGQLHDSAE